MGEGRRGRKGPPDVFAVQKYVADAGVSDQSKERSGITDAEADWLTGEADVFFEPRDAAIARHDVEGQVMDCQADFQETIARIVAILDESRAESFISPAASWPRTTATRDPPKTSTSSSI